MDHTKACVEGEVNISGSKSESNRLLILQSLFEDLQVENLSNSDDTVYLSKALAGSHENAEVNIGHAGTAMRFLTAYFAAKKNANVVLTGSSRMKERPIGILVDALRQMGAGIDYVEKEGYPPLRINGKTLEKREVSIQGNVSSQYLSALLMMGASLPEGLRMTLVGEVTSVPYLKMTLSLLSDLGASYVWKDNVIDLQPIKSLKTKSFTVESDWSSASYFFSCVALVSGAEVFLTSFKADSLQGDRALVDIYAQLGVSTSFEKGGIRLVNTGKPLGKLELDLVNCPDLAQTIAVTCFGLGMACDLTGLHTLKIKETDRLVALDQELRKFGAEIRVTDKSLHLAPSKGFTEGVSVDTYDDHRMAMAFAPLSLKVPLSINEAEVVTKSFRDFWADFASIMH